MFYSSLPVILSGPVIDVHSFLHLKKRLQSTVRLVFLGWCNHHMEVADKPLNRHKAGSKDVGKQRVVVKVCSAFKRQTISVSLDSLFY